MIEIPAGTVHIPNVWCQGGASCPGALSRRLAEKVRGEWPGDDYERPPEGSKTKVVDLMAALEASLAQAKGRERTER